MKKAWEQIIVITPAHVCDPQIAVAACRAGELGILDLGLQDRSDIWKPALEKLASGAGPNGRWGIRWDTTLGWPFGSPDKPAETALNRPPMLILANAAADALKATRDQVAGFADHVIVEVYDLASARAAQAAGYDGIIAKGNEAGGRVGRQSSFILLQDLYAKLDIPHWIQGGIGPNTAAAASVAGATGFVLCEQLWLTLEAPFTSAKKAIWRSLDGSETICLDDQKEVFRGYNRRGPHQLDAFEKALVQGRKMPEILNEWLSDPGETEFIACGQDIGLASGLADRFGTVGRILAAVRQGVSDNLSPAAPKNALAPHAPLAEVHGTRYPIVQGPMANVSDTVSFAKAVAHAGGLPFLALSAMTAPMIRNLLEGARTEMGASSWGVGVLGFLPNALRREQFEVICEFKPPFAVIAGGIPSQAKEYEAAGISAYLHVPSPGLLSSFIKDGARKLIFEGRECGGHVGPLTGFILWESAVNTLIKMDVSDIEELQVLFAGGIHHGLSAAMIQALAAPLTDIGIKIGVLMGTAYLFTTEAVELGAITPEYQMQAIACKSTAMVKSGVGHESCCIPTPFVEKFFAEKQKLIQMGKPDTAVRQELELMNLGRLRIAAKGISCRFEATHDAEHLKHVAIEEVPVDEETQRKEGLYLIGQLAQLRDSAVSMVDLHADVSEKSRHYLSRAADRHSSGSAKAVTREPIAVIGMACMFPGAVNVRAFWENIVHRRDAIREVSDDRWRPDDFFDPDRLARDKIYSKWGGFLDDVQFDLTRYGIPPASLSAIEPMHLLALEVARQALDDAGFDRMALPRERTAVIFGSGGIHDLCIDYVFRTMLTHYLNRVEWLPGEQRRRITQSLYQKLPEWTEDSFPGMLGNVIAGRIANRLDLHGSNFTVDAACASSLAAMDVGVNRLRSGAADLVLVGSADGANNAVSFMAFAKTQALSPRGRSSPFDDKADGIVISEGVAALVLKRLNDAERDGDRIYCLIKGIGSSSDGRNRSLTAPHPQGQVRAVRQSYIDAGVDPASVELIEAHGTGTAVGDKAEIESLNLAFGDQGHNHRQYCAVGSIKSMIGHSKVSAGLAGVIKSALALKHRLLPATINVQVPNSHVDFTQTPFYINTENRPWFKTRNGQPRRSGVSAFGFGGTNFHVVLEEYVDAYRPADALDYMPRGAEIFAFRRGRRSEIEQALKLIMQKIKHPEDMDLDQFAYSVFLEERRGRTSDTAQDCRLVIVATSTADLQHKLQSALQALKDKNAIHNPKGIYYREDDIATGKVCFLFPGQGSQKLDMLKDLVMSMPAHYNMFEQADRLLEDRLPQPLSSYIYPLPSFSDEERNRRQNELNDTRVAQPALGVVDFFAFKVLEDFGLKPDVVAGHSYGEYAALCAAGVISFDDLTVLSEIRGRIVARVSQANPGAMAAVQADERTVRDMIAQLELSVTPANVNTPDQTVVAGSIDTVDQAIAALSAKGLVARKIPVTAAFHTAAMAEAGKALKSELEQVVFQNPACRVYSNTLGGPYPDSPQDMRDLLERHICEPVRFLDQVQTMYRDGVRVFVEAGPGRVLGSMVDRILFDQPHTTLHFDSPGRSGWIQLAHLLGQALTLGLPIDLDRWFSNRRLADIDPDTVFEQARSKAAPGPLIWRVNGGKAVPWNQTADAQSIQSEEFDAPQITSMEPELQSKSDNALLSQIHSNMDQLIGLQQQQQQTLQRLLDMQERLMSAAFPGRTVHPVSSQPSSGAGTTVLQSPAGPPPPVLPKFVVPSGADGSNRATSLGIPVAPTAFRTATMASDPATTGTDAGKGLVSTEQFQVDLLRAVSQRTGYPVEMLELDAHLEAELGIDSIKRVEIFNNLKNHHDFLEGRDEATVLEDLAGLKTLKRIIEWYDTNRIRALEGEKSSAEQSDKPPATPANEDRRPSEKKSAGHKVRRFTLTAVPAPLNASDSQKRFPSDHLIVLLGEAPALSAGLHAALTGSGYRVRQIVSGPQTRDRGNNRFEVDFSSQASVKALHELLVRSGEKIGSVFSLLGLAAATDNFKDDHLDDAQKLFLVLKVFEKDLKASASNGGGWLINFTALDGQFGLQNGRAFPVGTAGTLGVAKSVAREWPGLRVKCIDIDPQMAPQMLVAQIWEEVLQQDPLVEVGLNDKGRWQLELSESLDQIEDVSRLDCNSESVLLVTGGACGITAEIVKSLAQKYRPRLVLVGRSPLPGEEAEETRSLQDVQALRQFLIDDFRIKTAKIMPADVERRLKRILKDRQIRANIATMEESGSDVWYHSLDIRNAEAFGELIDAIYTKWERIDGVLHGAGVVQDHLVRDKSLESFNTVFNTKVVPATVLAAKLRPEKLKSLVFFSSVAARFGNIGQCDYSAANEVLNKMANRLSREWPHVNVVAINWGPWDSGMVGDELRELYAQKDIHLVPTDIGVRLGCEEVLRGNGNVPEVVIASSVEQISQWGLGKNNHG